MTWYVSFFRSGLQHMSSGSTQSMPSFSQSVSGPSRLARPFRVLLLEPDAVDAELVERALTEVRADVVVRRLETDDAFENAVVESAPDALVVDHQLARRLGSAVVARLRALRPAAPLIMLLRSIEEDTVIDLLRAAPDDIVLKSNVARLGGAIERGMRSRRPLADLSPRQLEVLVLVAEGLSTREIAELRGLSVKTIESHRGAMMKRLGLHDVAGLVRYAVKMGLVRADGCYAERAQ
jgi:DNA-binding NarL/FixJ family response regulator